MRVSVIVLTWNGTAVIEPCLHALRVQGLPAEIIVVDNGSTDGTPDLVAGRFPGIRLIRNSCNLGFAGGNNVGLAAATGDLLILLNDDTEVHPGFLSAMVRAFDDATVGIAGAKLLYPDGTIQHAGGYLHDARGATEHHGRHLPGDGHFEEAYDPEFVTGAALAIRRTTLQQVGFLDEGFSPIYYEDVDWCYRASAAGWRVVYVPQAIVTHHESATADRQSYRHKLTIHQTRLRFLLKHRTLEELRDEFGPAEVAWLQRLPRATELMAARGAYLSSLLELSGILAFRDSTTQEAHSIIELLVDLRRASLSGLMATSSSGVTTEQESGLVRANLDRLNTTKTLQEYTFTSNVPVLGRFIVALRNTWGSIATKWYVRSLIQQQNDVNEQIIAFVEGQQQEIAQNHRELTVLAQRLACLEQQIVAARPDPSHPEEG